MTDWRGIPEEYQNQIVTGDARLLAERLPDGCIDLTVTSPPYDNLRTYNGYVFDFESIANQLYRVTQPGGVVVWVVGDETVNGSETGTSFRQALYFKEIGFSLETMIYQKNGVGAVGSNYYYWQSFEYMFILCKGSKPRVSNLLRDRKNKKEPQTVTWIQGKRYQNGEIKPKRTWTMKEYGIRFNVWLYNVGKNSAYKEEYAKEHPAIFPEALARDHILSWSNPGDIVLDPMCGSGTALKMAKELGRPYLGFDISPEYVALSKRRLEATNPPLFTLQPQQAELFERGG